MPIGIADLKPLHWCPAVDRVATSVCAICEKKFEVALSPELPARDHQKIVSQALKFEGWRVVRLKAGVYKWICNSASVDHNFVTAEGDYEVAKVPVTGAA